MLSLKSYIADFTKNLSEDDKKKIKEEGIVNYLPDSDLEKIIDNRVHFNEFISYYELNKHFIDLAIKMCPDRTKDFAIILKKYGSLFTIEDFKALFKNKDVSELWQEVISEISYQFSDDVYLYLFNAKYIIGDLHPDRIELIVRDKLKDKKIEDMNLEEMAALSALRKLTSDEIEIFFKKMLSEKNISIQKDALGILTCTQNLPVHMVETLIKKWDYEENSERWFIHMLHHQNLDTVADYIIEKHKFDNELIDIIKKNKMTSEDTIQKLCKNTL